MSTRRRHAKTVTRQLLIGEKGIALISRRCLDMGYVFHPRRVDHGIDGHIDLIDPGTGAVLNLTLLVQSKAQDRPFAGEDDHSFRYVCDQRDLDLWLAGNAPVLLVLSHPERDEAWWAEVKRAFPDARARASRTVQIDKHRDAFDASAAGALLSLAQPKTAGLYLQPPPIHERLLSNLLPIVTTPPRIYTARAVTDDYTEAWCLLPDPRMRIPAWSFSEGELVSFEHPLERGLAQLCDGPVHSVETETWRASDDRALMNRFIRLLSAAVEHAHPELRRHSERRHLHFRASDDLLPRKAGRRPGAPGRTVFAPHYAKSDPTRVSYYHHAALRTRYRRLGTRWYCQLEPDYCFTYDGYSESSFADSLLSGIKRRERHEAVAGWTAMWAAHLTRDPDLFSRPHPVRFGPQLAISVERGIDEKWWGSAPVQAMRDDDVDDLSGEAQQVEADLVAADVDVDDLSTLLDDSEDVTPTSDAEESPSQVAAHGRHSRRGGLRRTPGGKDGARAS